MLASLEEQLRLTGRSRLIITGLPPGNEALETLLQETAGARLSPSPQAEPIQAFYFRKRALLTEMVVSEEARVVSKIGGGSVNYSVTLTFSLDPRGVKEVFHPTI